jgi:hypothetical protein
MGGNGNRAAQTERNGGGRGQWIDKNALLEYEGEKFNA